MKKNYLFLSLLLSACSAGNQSPLPTQPSPASENLAAPLESDDYLLNSYNEKASGYEYKNTKGTVIIAAGKYEMCFTDTFKTYAIVVKANEGIIAIDRNENTLYSVFAFDNGPDEISEGYFRVIENAKIGFAVGKTGAIAIKPQYDCAWPFENGKAKVSKHCIKKKNGEHTEWTSDKWIYIDRGGNEVEP